MKAMPHFITLQALRMAINGEREQMMRGMRAAFKMLKLGGVIAVISWKHSEVRHQAHALPLPLH
jgi:16S rRNA C1402 N4-methylase RsmH